MAEDKKTSKAKSGKSPTKKSSVKGKDTKSTVQKSSAKTKGAKSTPQKTSAAKPGAKAPAKQRSAPKKETVAKALASETKTPDKSNDKSFLVDAAENIDAGAKIVRDRTAEFASDFAEKASGFKDTLFHRVKKGVSEAYEAGSKAIEELTETAQDYAEKYKHKIEITKLKAKQDKQYTKLGSIIYEKYKVAGMTADKLFKEQDIKELINDIEDMAEQIVEQGKALDKNGERK